MTEKDPKRFYVYAYLRSQDSERGKKLTPYYIGKGSYQRAWTCKGRFVKKPADDNFIVMLRTGLTEDEAFQWEMFYIQRYGRLDLGTGVLHNRTEGGEGASGIIIPERARQIHRENRQREGRWKGDKNPKAGGDPVRGEKNPMWGKNHTPETRGKMSSMRKQRNQETHGRHAVYKRAAQKYLYELIDPDGEVYVTENLFDFSKQYGLTNANLSKVVNGKFSHHRGWTGRIIERLN